MVRRIGQFLPRAEALDFHSGWVVGHILGSVSSLESRTC
jgi:hypothetical protein